MDVEQQLQIEWDRLEALKKHLHSHCTLLQKEERALQKAYEIELVNENEKQRRSKRIQETKEEEERIAQEKKRIEEEKEEENLRNDEEENNNVDDVEEWMMQMG